MPTKTIRIAVQMVEVDFCDLINHVGENVWFSPGGDTAVTHGPFMLGTLGDPPDEKLVLFPPNLMYIEVAGLHLNKFWQIQNDPCLLFEKKPPVPSTSK